MRSLDRGEKVRITGQRSSVYSFHGRIHFTEGSAAKRLDGSVRRNWWPNVGLFGRARLQFVGRNLQRAPFNRPGVDRLFLESVQLNASRLSCWWTNCNGSILVDLVARL